MTLSVFWALAIFAIDRISKIWAQNWLAVQQGMTLPALEKIFRFRYAQNTGAAFSIFAGNTWMLAAATILMLACVLAVLLRGRARLRAPMRYGLLLILGGGAGNLYDRLAHGYVIDFIELTFMRFAVFNLADICICLGAAIVALALILPEKEAQHGGVDD